ncbi:MAG TPA: TIM44-like domain-containing protein [Gemmataceae bacterium]|nr:TIM44-like domain-containing protein [Gemmataceae bacterium]
MRARFALAAAVLLVTAATAAAQGEAEAQKTFHWIGYVVCGTACLAISGAIFWYFLSHFLQEQERGRRRAPLDEIPDDFGKRPKAVFRGEKVPDWQTAPRHKATKAILKFLSYTDNWYEKNYVSDVADEAFRLVKDAIEARSVQGLEKRMTPECLEDLRTEIKKLKKEREVRVFGRVRVTDVDVLHVETPPGKVNHTFTALISAESRDYVEDSESGELLRGDKKLYAYQEFYTFRRTEKRWVVELIRPSADVDAVLASKNVLAKIDLEEFAKDAEPEFLKEVVAK